MIVHYKKDGTKIVLEADSEQEVLILRMLFENRINLKQHALLLTKEKPSHRIAETGDTEEWRITQHL
jgi:hypothetical protein